MLPFDDGDLSLAVPGLFSHLESAQQVLLCGAGGGFDVYAALPVAIELQARGKSVAFCGISFTEFDAIDPATRLTHDLIAVHPDTALAGRDPYFPERSLARWLTGRHRAAPVYALRNTGVVPLRAALERIVERDQIDAVVLVDGGTDLLMRGDEAQLGTPGEDSASLPALSGLTGLTKLAACIGFGIDAYHGVNHVLVLENIVALERVGGYLGAFSIPGRSPAGRAYVDAVNAAHAEAPLRASIVNGQIAAALQGASGDIHFTARTSASELFVNPLMAIYFTFLLDAVAGQNHYLQQLEHTTTRSQVLYEIDTFRNELPTYRAARTFPH